MKEILSLVLLTVCLIFTASAQEFKQANTAYGQPLLVLTETNPGLKVPGADVPSFALYEGGQIIYKQSGNSGERYYHTQLAQEQLQELIGSLLITQDLMRLPEKPATAPANDQPVNRMVLNFDTLLVKQVYGDLRNDERARKKAPVAFLKVYDNLIAYSESHAREWLPQKIEVLVTDYLKTPEQTIKWPAAWPTLKSPDTIWRSEKLYSLYLDSRHYPELLDLMNRLKEDYAVEINGKKFTISYRLPFPNIQ
ncbi:hypothetical protein [Cesiribacter sp. SM1]|uniref:hypothetical protein n=1 Tax=Cesiribacter sp. SM1 TaxID=2861196 RepID=UPI001CD531E5|nr:hypothetical protein [Cesiribacter sp. SM1]